MPPAKINKEVRELNKSLFEKTNEAKKELSSNKTTKEINNSIADLVGNLKDILDDASKANKSIDKELDSLIVACGKCEKQFEDTESVSVSQLKSLEKVCDELDEVDIDIGDNKKTEDLQDKCMENIKKFSDALEKAAKLLEARLERQKKKSNAIIDLNKDLNEAIEDAKELVSEDISSKKISDDLSDLLSDLEQDLDDASKCAKIVDKELDELVEQCHSTALLFKNSDEITDEQLEAINGISMTCTKVDIDIESDDSLEKKVDSAFANMSKVLNKTKNILSKQKKSCPPAIEALQLINKIISGGTDSFEKNYNMVFDVIEKSCELIKKTGQGLDAINSLNSCIKACKNADDNWDKSDKGTKFILLTEVCNSIKLTYNCVFHPKFKKEIKEIIDKLNSLSRAFK